MVQIRFQIQYKLHSIDNICGVFSVSKENNLDSLCKNKQNGSVSGKPFQRVQVVQFFEELKLIHLYK